MSQPLVLTGEERELCFQAAGVQFANRYSDTLRYNRTTGEWLSYEGGRWTNSGESAAERFSKELTDLYFDAANDAAKSGNGDWSRKVSRFAHQLSNASGVRKVLFSTRSEPSVEHRADDFDSDGRLFNVENCTIALSDTYESSAPAYHTYPHRPTDLLTKRANVSYDRGATCPRFERFLTETFDGDGDLISYLQRLLGSCLAAGNPDEVFPICWGTGGNGKTKLFEVVLRIFGDYGRMLPGDSLREKRAGAASNDIAGLKGIRLAVASELTDRGIDIRLVKRLTGGERISARRLYAEFEEIENDWTVIAYSNDKPKLPADDEGVWRRAHLIPFTVVVPDAQRERKLADVLWNERSGILNWLLDGYAEWLQHGLNPPPAVDAATAAFRNELDVVKRFVDETCDVDPGLKYGAAALQSAFREWCRENGESPCTAPQLKARLERLHFTQSRANSNKTYNGLAPRQEAAEQLPQVA